MKNYYEILEVNPKASKEVIEKAYKVLIKKYHPDLYTGEKQQQAERKTKDINEAYHVLSDEFLKEQYDIELKRQEAKEREDKYEREEKQKIKRAQTSKRVNHESKPKSKKKLQERQTAHQVGSIGSIVELTTQLVRDLIKNTEKREKAKKITKTDLIAGGLTIVIIILLGIVLWFIPFTNGWMRELLFENPLFNWIGSLFSR